MSPKNINQESSSTLKSNVQIPQNSNNNLNIYQNQTINKSGVKPSVITMNNNDKNLIQGKNNPNPINQSTSNQLKVEKDTKPNNTTSKFQNLTINTGNNLNTGNSLVNPDKKQALTTKNEGNKPKIFQNIQLNLKNTSPKNVTSKKIEKVVETKK